MILNKNLIKKLQTYDGELEVVVDFTTEDVGYIEPIFAVRAYPGRIYIVANNTLPIEERAKERITK